MKRKILFMSAAALGIAALMFAQQFEYHGDQDPWWRPLNPAGQSYGVTYGLTRPTNPANGEVFVDMNGATDSGPKLEIYDGVNAAWDSLGAAVAAGSGTTNALIKFDSSDNLADSTITDDGTNVDMATASLIFKATSQIIGDTNLFVSAGAAGGGYIAHNFGRSQFVVTSPTANTDILEEVVTIPITAAGQTTNIFKLEPTNADHTGGTVNGFLIGAITGDAQATEHAINIGDGWDSALTISDNTAVITFGPASANSALSIQDGDSDMSFVLNSTTGSNRAALTGAVDATVDFLQLAATAQAMGGSQTENVVSIELTNANHTVGSNVVNGINIGAITGDAEATESAINIGSGWDLAINIAADGTSATNAIQLGAGGSTDAQIYFDGSSLVFDVDAASNTIRNFTSAGANAWTVENGASGNAIRWFPAGTAGSGGDLFTLEYDFIEAMDGSDTMNLFFINLTNANHTGASNLVNGISLAAITGDPQADETGVRVGTGWDVAIQANGPINGAGVYDDFTDFEVLQTDLTAESVTDDEDNYIYTGAPGVPGAAYVMRVEQSAGQALTKHVANGGLLFSPDATENDGLDIAFSRSPLTGPFTFGQHGTIYVEFSITISDISTLDGDIAFGMRNNTDFADPPTIGDTYGAFTISDNAGDLDIECDVNAGGVANDDTGVTWGDGETHIVRLEFGSDSIMSAAYVDGAAITITNCGAAGNTFEAGDKYFPYLYFTVGAEGADPGIKINYISYGEVQS